MENMHRSSNSKWLVWVTRKKCCSHWHKRMKNCNCRKMQYRLQISAGDISIRKWLSSWRLIFHFMTFSLSLCVFLKKLHLFELTKIKWFSLFYLQTWIINSIWISPLTPLFLFRLLCICTLFLVSARFYLLSHNKKSSLDALYGQRRSFPLHIAIPSSIQFEQFFHRVCAEWTTDKETKEEKCAIAECKINWKLQRNIDGGDIVQRDKKILAGRFTDEDKLC